jgi:hypothetical protein
MAKGPDLSLTTAALICMSAPRALWKRRTAASIH